MDERISFETELSLRDWRDLIGYLERQYQSGTANGREHHPHTLMLDRVLDALPDIRLIDELIAGSRVI